MSTSKYITSLQRANKSLTNKIISFQKIKTKHNKQFLNFARNYFIQRKKNSGNIDNLKYLMILTHSGLTNKKNLRTILYYAVHTGDTQAALFFVELLGRELTYSELARLAKFNNSLEWMENYFPERIGEIAAKGVYEASQKALTTGHKFRHDGNIL